MHFSNIACMTKVVNSNADEDENEEEGQEGNENDDTDNAGNSIDGFKYEGQFHVNIICSIFYHQLSLKSSFH